MRYLVAGLVAAALGLIDIPATQLPFLLTWSKRTSLWIVPAYLLVAAGGGLAAVALAGSVNGAGDSTQNELLRAALLGAAGHATMRAAVRRRKADGDAALAASVFERFRSWLETLWERRAIAAILPVITGLGDEALLDLAADLGNPPVRSSSEKRRRELEVLLKTAESFGTANAEQRPMYLRGLRTALRTEIVTQQKSRGEVKRRG
jgi:hypothetical protein